MNGPDHFRAAEEDLDWAREAPDPEGRANALASAQVHATLALAAATAEDPDADRLRWYVAQAASEHGGNA